MQCTERKTTTTRLLRPCGRGADRRRAWLLVPAAKAQMNPPQARPQAQSPQTPSPADAIGINFRRKAECHGCGYRAGRHHPAELRKQDRGSAAV
jgi:hypothetical protein